MIKMKYYKLDKYEQEILDAVERGKFKRVKNEKEEIKKLREAARATFQKTRNINIRLTEKDLYLIKEQAGYKGIPYQTLAASILHQYSTGQIKEVA